MELCFNQKMPVWESRFETSLEKDTSYSISLVNALKKIHNVVCATVTYLDFSNISYITSSFDKIGVVEKSFLTASIEDGVRRYSLLNPGCELDRSKYQYAFDCVAKFVKIEKPYIVFSDESVNVVFFYKNKRCSFQYYLDEPKMVAVSIRNGDRIEIRDFDNDKITDIWKFCE